MSTSAAEEGNRRILISSWLLLLCLLAISLLELLPLGQAFSIDFRRRVKLPIEKVDNIIYRYNRYPNLSMSKIKSSAKTEKNLPKNEDSSSSLSPVYPNWRTIASDSVNAVSPFRHNFENTQVNAPWSEKSFQSSLDLYQSLSSCPDSYISNLIKEALISLDHAYRLYGPESVVGSFNGGKDAVVILELMRAAHAKYYHDQMTAANESGNSDTLNCLTRSIAIRPRVLYFNNKLEFPEVLKFVRETVDKYDLDMVAFEEGIGFVDGLEIMVKENYVHPCNVANSTTLPPYPMAFVLGTRDSDPNAGDQATFSPSSTWMPSFMRVNPVLNWSYGHVWHFLRLYKLPYCTLYDAGYTSLGTIEDTNPCPALKKVDTDSTKIEGNDYWPAYMLKDWDLERAGRIKKETKKPSVAASSTRTESVPNTKNDSVTVASSSQSSEKASEETVGIISDTKNDDSLTPLTSPSSVKSQRTVGILIIGDEILKGLTPDTNTHAAALALHASNVPLSRVVVVSDDQDEIIAEIKRMETIVDVIITSGGVGPTHDDVTIKSVADALSSDMVLNDKMAKLLVEKMGGGDSKEVGGNDSEELCLTEAQIKMATLPTCAKLLSLSDDPEDWPVLQCQHIFILPGVPQFFLKKIEDVARYLSTELEKGLTFKVVLSIDESSIVPTLNAVVLNHPNVSFGSYPFVDHPEYKTVVTLEGRKLEGGHFRNSGRNFFNATSQLDEVTFSNRQIDTHVKVALSDLVNQLPKESVLRVDNNTAWTLN